VGKIGDAGHGESDWMTIPEAFEKRINTEPALQRKLLTAGRTDITDEGLSYTWIDPSLMDSSSFICNLLVICFFVPAGLIIAGILLVLLSVLLPLLLFPYVLWSHTVDQARCQQINYGRTPKC
jgi:hypothetical protein